MLRHDKMLLIFISSECEYGGPLQAMLAGDFKAVSLLADGVWKIPRYEIRSFSRLENSNSINMTNFDKFGFSFS